MQGQLGGQSCKQSFVLSQKLPNAPQAHVPTCGIICHELHHERCIFCHYDCFNDAMCTLLGISVALSCKNSEHLVPCSFEGVKQYNKTMVSWHRVYFVDVNSPKSTNPATLSLRSTVKFSDSFISFINMAPYLCWASIPLYFASMA